MNTTRLNRLIELNDRTSDIVEFKKLWDPDTQQWVDDGTGTNVANAVVGAGVLGVGGYAGHRIIQNAGGYGAVATNVRNKIAPVVAAAGPKIATASTAAATKVASLLSRLKNVRFESREARLIHLNAQADELLKFESPLAEFNREHRKILNDRIESYKSTKAGSKTVIREARSANRKARIAVQETELGLDPAVKPLQEKLRRESYAHRGVGIGAGVGAALGTGLGAAVGARRGARAAGAILGGTLGVIHGAHGGLQIGGRIRRKNPLPS